MHGKTRNNSRICHGLSVTAVTPIPSPSQYTPLLLYCSIWQFRSFHALSFSCLPTFISRINKVPFSPLFSIGKLNVLQEEVPHLGPRILFFCNFFFTTLTHPYFFSSLFSTPTPQGYRTALPISHSTFSIWGRSHVLPPQSYYSASLASFLLLLPLSFDLHYYPFHFDLLVCTRRRKEEVQTCIYCHYVQFSREKKMYVG